ncbi:protein HIGH CHLOROPHYLL FLUORESCENCE PHENOTYPE 173, chloroplastic isoform X1 [Gastrolobium bilobum]|uniref:protein HIGH CHLOROPHYLL FLUORESCENCE PHENOTYPE 173, chloroplastic isoform X1 n=2 Tax=Gastrolobium bilobum TaxID=150636 RepID=UPI002AB0E449|nr:protein HIGH CHLOROPHYLL FLUORESCENCE PHENOTYPE 173, chloroplastic isoform X1 [Gastrolobium bilobum]
MELCFTTLSSPASTSILNFQGPKLPGRKFCKKSSHPFLASPTLPKPFLQIYGRPRTLIYERTSTRASAGTYRATISAEAGKQSWDFGRFIKTLYFFNGPPSPAKFFDFLVEKLSGPSPSESVNSMGTSDIVLVAGATGGVGRRVVDILRKKGIPVRVLVRNEEKARRMLGSDVDLVVGDITKDSTLIREYFKGVKKVINTVSVIVGPKEGDTPDRAKYSQGIKFFEPEIKGDSPEKVEYIGMRNLIKAVKDNLGLRRGKLLFGFEGDNYRQLSWGALDDVVMGGVSESTFQIDPRGSEDGGPTGVFKGVVSTANNGGFTSIRTKNFSEPEDLSAYDGLEFRLKGDGHRYKVIVRTSRDWDTVGYTAGFNTEKGKWQLIQLPFSSLRPVFRARTVSDAPPFDPSNVASLQLMFSKFEYDGKLNETFMEGPFELPVSSIRAYIKDPITPRFVHVSSAGVTRPERPGLDLSKQPPAVRLNKELDYILTFKLKGEDLLRESGIPYVIVRPCALTEEPAGADLIFDQGDNITGKISREEVARMCVAALEIPYACDKTFEVKSVVPFSEPFTVDPANPPPEKDYDTYFKNLKEGITGKEALQQNPIPV